MARDETPITLTETENRILKLLEEADTGLLTSKQPLIQKVTPILRACYSKEECERYFEPISVALGPIHQEDPNGYLRYQRGEKSKLRLAAMFIKNSGRTKEDFYNNVKKEINNLRKSYDPKDVEKWNDEELASMFLVDGCALLNFIHLDVNKRWEELGGKNYLVAFAKLDLFFLENQLPYQLLKILMKTCASVPSYEKEKGSNPASVWENSINAVSVLENSINRFINMNDISPEGLEPQSPKEIPIPIFVEFDSPPHDHHQYEHHQQQLEGEREGGGEEPAHLLELLRRRLIYKEGAKLQKEKEPDSTSGKNWHSFRSIKELKEHGISCKASETSSVMDITFRPNFYKATLKLPPIKVDDYTVPKLMNLVAYEMCPDFMNNFEITSYVSFLDSLIDKVEDVKELRDAGVLDNRLGSDKAVARLFNKISTNLVAGVPNPSQHNGLKHRIHEHCNTAWSTYFALLYHTHFSSPWSILAFLGALFGLSLTAAQTYKSFN